MADEKLSSNIMLEASLILAKNRIHDTFQNVRILKKEFSDLQFYYPQSLIRMVESHDYSKENLGEYFLFNAPAVEAKEVYTLLKQNSDIITGFEIGTFGANKEYYEIFENVDQDLGYLEEPFREYAYNILNEEWVFLAEKSWLVSRIKKPFNSFIEAGAVCLHSSGRATDKLINRTLRRSNDHVIENVDRLRALGKWIAVGGAAAVGAWAPPVLNFLGSSALGYFVLFDPPK